MGKTHAKTGCGNSTLGDIFDPGVSFIRCQCLLGMKTLFEGNSLFEQFKMFSDTQVLAAALFNELPLSRLAKLLFLYKVLVKFSGLFKMFAEIW